jgi:hypothetical protein
MLQRLLSWFLAIWFVGVCSASAQAATFTSAHFRFSFDESRLSRPAAEAAAQDAERAYAYNQEQFSSAGPPEIQCDLSPRFMGATGYAQPDRRPPVIAVRIPDLDYLGLEESYVLRHEIAHVFSGRLAGGPMGEGLADYVAGGFGDLPLAQWWGPALRGAGLWVDPDALFVTGDFPAAAELDARQRTATYTEPALLIQFLVARFGFGEVLAFLPDYGRARHTLESNDAAGRHRGFRPPDPAAVQSAFQHHFGRSWGDLRADWERQMLAANGSEDDRRRLIIRQETYAAIRNYEMWVIAQPGRMEPGRAAAVRRAFTEVNVAIRAQRLEQAGILLRKAQGLVNELKRPALVAHASLRPAPASNMGLTVVPQRTAALNCRTS